MHLNPQHPNILHDMQAAANGRDLRDGKRIAHMDGLIPTGRLAVLPTAKRHLIPRKSYPYASERQVKRQQSTAQRLAFNHSFALNTKPSYIRLQRRILKAETQG